MVLTADIVEISHSFLILALALGTPLLLGLPNTFFPKMFSIFQNILTGYVLKIFFEHHRRVMDIAMEFPYDLALYMVVEKEIKLPSIIVSAS